MSENTSSENIIIVKENEILQEVSQQSAANNPVEEVPVIEEQPNAEQSSQEGAKEEKKEGPPHSSKYYTTFAKMAHGSFDKLYELVNQFIIPIDCPVSKDGLKKRLPGDYEEMVTMLAEQLEVSEVKIQGWIGILLYGNIVASTYGGLIADNIKRVNEWKKEQEKKKGETAVIKTETTKEEAKTFSQATEVHTALVEKADPRVKRGNPHKHKKDCDCYGCEKLGIHAFQK